MRKLLPIMFLFLLIPAVASAALLNASAPSGVNGLTWEQQFQTLVANSLNTRFNTTQTYSNGTHTLLWVPKFTSSTACGVAELQSYSGACTTVNMSRNAMVTDEFSEVGLALAMSNRTTEFDYFYNTVTTLIGTGAWGSAPYWIYCRNGTSISDLSGADSASDGTARIILAFYVASQNNAFSDANRTKYLTLGNSMAVSHYQYETRKESYSTMFGTVDVWLAGGRDAAQAFSSDPFIWGGYFSDAIKSMLAACAQTSNQTYCAAANNYTMQMLAAQLNNTGGGSSDFRVSPFSWRYTSGPPAMFAGNTYHFNGLNEQWDDSDRPRGLQDCDVLRVANITYAGNMPAIYQNLSDYCTAWGKSGTYNNTFTTLQYYYNGTSSSSPTTGFYQNGLGAFLHTYYNVSGLVPKINETLSHYGYAGLTFDSTSCGNGMTYRGVRPTKAIATAIGKEELIYNLSLANSIDVDIFNSANGSRIYDTINITLTGTLTSNTTSTNTSTILFSGLPSDTYTLTFSGANWTTTQYIVTVSGGSITQLNAYLTSSIVTGNNTVVFTVNDRQAATQLIEGATVVQSQDINGTLTVVQSKTTDITGRVVFNYVSGTRYSFTISKSGYQSLTFELNPILFSSYDVGIDRVTTLNTSIDYFGVTTSINDTTFLAGEATSVLFTFSSASGSLTSYSFNITYPSGSQNFTGTNAYGQNFNPTFTITNSTVYQTVTINYCYTTSTAGQRCFAQTYIVTPTPAVTTLIANRNQTFGLGVLERVIIAIGIVIVVMGVTIFIGGPIASFALGLFLLGFFVYIGFLPLWSVLISMVVGLFIIGRRSGE